MKKIGFVGTEFPDFITFANSIVQEQFDLEFLLDKPSSVHFLTSEISGIMCSSVLDQEYQAARSDKVLDRVLSNVSLFSIFQCDMDRLSYFKATIPSESELLHCAEKLIFGYLNWVEKNSIDVVLFEGPNNFFLRLVQQVSILKNIELVSFRLGRRADSVFVGRADPAKMFFAVGENLPEGQFKLPNYMDQSHPNHRSLWSKIVNMKNTSLYRDLKSLKTFRLIRHEEKILCYFTPFLTLLFKGRIDFLKIRLRRKVIASRFFKDVGSMASDERTVVCYPEHFHPEASTSAYDYNYIDDIKNIENIRRLLPSEYRLVYRFHPSQWGRDTLFRYKRLSKIPGVEFSTPSQSSREVVNLSDYCISVSSSMALDFIRDGKSAVLFGNSEMKNVSSRLLMHRDGLQEGCKVIVGLAKHNDILPVMIEGAGETSIGSIYTNGSFSDLFWIKEIFNRFSR
jgi:hypothetical protein